MRVLVAASVLVTCISTGAIAQPNYSKFPDLPPIPAPPPPRDYLGDFVRGYQAGKMIRGDIEAQQAATAALAAMNAQAFKTELAGRVGALLAKGDCEQAINLSLAQGDIELANQAKTFCAAKPAN